MLRDYLYLDTEAVAGYLSALEDGSRTAVERRTARQRGVSGGINVGPAEARGEGTNSVDETESLADTDDARFSRLLRLAHADPEGLAWEHVLQPDSVLPEIGVGAMIEAECDVYIPDMLKVATPGSSILQTVEDFRGVASLAGAFGADTSEIPSADQIDSVQSMVGAMKLVPMIVGEFDEAEYKLFGQLDPVNIKVDDIDGPANIVGKVKRRVGPNAFAPLLVSPATSGLGRKQRRKMERQRPTEEDQDNFVEGPAIEIKVIAIYR